VLLLLDAAMADVKLLKKLLICDKPKRFTVLFPVGKGYVLPKQAETHADSHMALFWHAMKGCTTVVSRVEQTLLDWLFVKLNVLRRLELPAQALVTKGKTKAAVTLLRELHVMVFLGK
jgi:hypothetical protein